ncbi:hypothetical protein JCM1840_007266 [Sporobolomyces johnsonii]
MKPLTVKGKTPLRVVKKEKPAGAKKIRTGVFVGLFVLATAMSLDNTTVSQYTTYATSSFDQVSTLGVITTLETVLLAVFRPFTVKLTALIGVAGAFSLALFLYTAGCASSLLLDIFSRLTRLAIADAAMAASKSIFVYGIGFVSGNLGVAAITVLQWTVLIVWSSSIAGNAALNSYRTLFRSSLAFCILVPASMTPLLVMFALDRRREKKEQEREALEEIEEHVPGESEREEHEREESHVEEQPKNWPKRFAQGLKEVGALALLLLFFALSGILVPFILVSQGIIESWSSPIFYSMLIVGAVCLVVLLVLEIRSKHPLFPQLIFKLRRTRCTYLATFLNMTSFYLLLTYHCSELYGLTIAHLFISYPIKWLVNKQTHARDTRFIIRHGLAPRLRSKRELQSPPAAHETELNTQEMRWQAEPKWWIALGHGMRLLGVGLSIVARNGSTGAGWIVLLFACQLLHGAGGAIANVYCLQISMAAVPKDDMAMANSFTQLVTDVGSAVGSALATFLWQNFLRSYLTSYLATTGSSGEVDEIFGSTLKARELVGTGGDTADAIVESYVHAMRILLFVALGFAAVSFLLSFAIGPVDISERQEPTVEAEMLAIKKRREGTDKNLDAPQLDGWRPPDLPPLTLIVPPGYISGTLARHSETRKMAALGRTRRQEFWETKAARRSAQESRWAEWAKQPAY